jgi:cardiolipin synthase
MVSTNAIAKDSVPVMVPGAYHAGNSTRLLRGGDDFFPALKDILDSATREIHLQFYIFNEDDAGRWVIELLSGAVRRGVFVYLLVDGYESRLYSREFVQSICGKGIRFARFEPLFRSKNFYVGRRMHHKVVVADGRSCIIGGVNIADRYKGNPDQRPWYDLALYFEGSSVEEARAECIKMWQDATGERLSQQPISTTQLTQPLFSNMHPCSVRIRRNDWVKNRNQIWKSYFELFNQASESIIIMCSYFLPGWIFLRQLKKARARGVRVTVILAGISDVMLAKHAERYLYRWMLRNGVEIYEYKESVLHAKVAIRDHTWMTLGSYNVNNISALASIELNADVRNKPFVSMVAEELTHVANHHSHRITRENFLVTQHPAKQLWQWCCYQTIKIVLFLATFYFRRER